MKSAFHLALPTHDLNETRKFYTEILGIKEMRSAFNWVDFDFYGNQLSFHLVPKKVERGESTMIDGDQVPARHYGLVLSKGDWEKLRDTIKLRKQEFVIGPRIRFADKAGEQGTFFIVDPSGNFLEFKYFTDESKGLWY